MAYDDTLFQLGMDLTRSSTAQTEDHSRSDFGKVSAEHDDRPDGARQVRSPVRNISIDLYVARAVSDRKSARDAMERAAASCGGELKSVQVYEAETPAQLAGHAVLDGGRMSFRSCVKSGITALDVHGVAGLQPSSALIAFAQAFGAREAVLRKSCRSALIRLDAMRTDGRNKEGQADSTARARAA